MRSTTMFVAMGLAGLRCAAPAGATPAGDRLAVAEALAPTIVQETRKDSYPNDYVAAVDYDGDLDGTNNFENLARFGRDGAGPPAVIYYTVMETPTHYFVHYLPYIPIDYKSGNGHVHDTEGLLVTVRKGAPANTIDAVETRWHNEWKTYAGNPLVLPGTDLNHGGLVQGLVQTDTLPAGNGHPLVLRERVGHGICGGQAPPGDLAYPESAKTAETEWLGLAADSAQFVVCTGLPILPYDTYVIYRFDPSITAGESPKPNQDTQVVHYELREILTSLWPERNTATLMEGSFTYSGTVANGCSPGTLFRNFKGVCPSFCSPAGQTCTSLSCRGTCNAPGLGCAADPPSIWGQSSNPGTPIGNPFGLPAPPIGEQFFDPAAVMSKRLTIPLPYSLAYVHNPYLGITDGTIGCPQ